MVTNLGALEHGVWAASSLHVTNFTHLSFLLVQGVFLIPWRLGAITTLLIFARMVSVYWVVGHTWLLGQDSDNDWLDFGCIVANPKSLNPKP